MAEALRLSVSHGESKPRVAIVGGGYLGSRIAAELGLANCDVKIYDRGAGPNVKQGVQRALCELEQCTRPSPAGPVLPLVHATLAGSEPSPSHAPQTKP